MSCHDRNLIKAGMAIFLPLLVIALPLGTVFAASPGTMGQPNQSCQ